VGQDAASKGTTAETQTLHLRKLKDRNLINSEKEAQTIYYSMTTEFQKLLKPFFKLIEDNKILETI
jgi:predicted transcriptional regulator